MEPVYFKLFKYVTRIIIPQRHNAHYKIITSRRFRKGLPVFHSQNKQAAHPDQPLNNWNWVWAPQHIHWWLAILFFIGAGCFAVTAAAVCWPHLLPWPFWRGHIFLSWGFFVGSWFFTSAAYLQLLEAINGDLLEFENSRRPWYWFKFKPHNLGYLSSLVQLIGTVNFNFNTGDPFFNVHSVWLHNLIVWVPNVVGSICFLVSSYLAIMEFCHDYWGWQWRSVSWWIVMVNLLGSIFFLLSCCYAFRYHGTLDPGLYFMSNLFTCLGGLCFMAGAYLLLPEMFEIVNGETGLIAKIQ